MRTRRLLRFLEEQARDQTLSQNRTSDRSIVSTRRRLEVVLRRRGHVLVSGWPPLPLQAWQASKDTLQLYTQIPGKIRMKLAPPEPQWAHVTYYVTARGITTGPMPYRDRVFQIDFDLVSHEFIVNVSDGGHQAIALKPRSVADFYEDVFAVLEELDILVDINPIPQEVPNPISFDKDTVHAAYDREYVARFGEVLRIADTILKRYRAPFTGRHTPVHFFWGGFDLAYSRYCGRPAPPPPGANKMMRVAMDAEETYAGFWLGDARFPEAAFAAYVYPKPDGLEQSKIAPSAAAWNSDIGLFILRYEDARTSKSPEDTVLEFFTSTYRACAVQAKWDPSLLV
jgi:hypothetical protein